jgi:hypothetical protein
MARPPVAMVVTMSGSFRRATAMPLSRPNAAPTAIAPQTASRSGAFVEISQPSVMAPSEATPGKERST